MLVQCRPVVTTRNVGRKTWIAGEIRPFHGIAERFPEFLGEAGKKKEAAVAALIVPIGNKGWMCTAQAWWRDSASQGLTISRNRAEDRTGQQREINLLTLPGAFTVKQCR